MGSTSSHPAKSQEKYSDEIKSANLKFVTDDQAAARSNGNSGGGGGGSNSSGSGTTDYTWLWWTLGTVGFLGLASIVGCVLCSYFANKRQAEDEREKRGWASWLRRLSRPEPQGRRFSQSMFYYVPQPRPGHEAAAQPPPAESGSNAE